MPDRLESFLRGTYATARAHSEGLTTEHESAELSHVAANSQARLCFAYLLGQPLAHFHLDRLITSRDGRAGRRTDVAKNLGLVMPTLLDAWNEVTQRWCVIWKPSPFGVEKAQEYGIEPLKVDIDIDVVRKRPTRLEEAG